MASFFPCISTQRQVGVYVPTYQFGKRNQFELQKILGDGPDRLVCQQATAQIPAHFTDPTDLSVCVFGFTTVKNRVKPILDPTSEEKLREWELRVGREEAERIRTEAVAAGKLLHRMLERWLLGKPLGPCPIDQQPYKDALATAILPYLHRGIPPLGITTNGRFYPLSELTLVDFDRGYFGRFDLVVELAVPSLSGYVLLELKGSRKEKELDHLTDTIIQVVAYLEIWELLVQKFPDQVPSLVGVVIAYAYGTGRGDVIPITGDDLQPYRKEWRLWLDTFFELLVLAFDSAA